MITGNGLDNVVLGGAGNDTIPGRPGGIYPGGGTGQDNISGGVGEDCLISDNFSYFSESSNVLNRIAFDAIMDKWTRLDADLAARIDHLRNGGGLGGSVRINSSTATSDGNSIDTILGGFELDWLRGHERREWGDIEL